MKRKRPPALPDPVFTFDDTAIVMMRTGDYAYQLAIMLNETYDLQLACIDDIYIGDTPYPCFFYNDEAAWLAYILISRPQLPDIDPAFTDYDKMLLIRGIKSWSFQKTLYDEIHSRSYGIALGSASEPDATDLIEHHHWGQCNLMAENIKAIDIFDFSSQRGIVSTLRLANNEPTLFPVEATAANNSENRAIATYHNTLKDFLNQTFTALQVHLCDEQDF